MKITHVVALDRQNGIGKNNELLWHIAEDLKHFKNTTSGGVVIMGRKTFESIGRPLPNRQNIIITRNNAFKVNGAVVTNSIDEALIAAKSHDLPIFILGGAEIYQQTLALADELIVTHVDTIAEADAFYPNFEHFEKVWQSQNFNDEKSNLGYHFAKYMAKPH